jgi:hypothetical protein
MSSQTSRLEGLRRRAPGVALLGERRKAGCRSARQLIPLSRCRAGRIESRRRLNRRRYRTVGRLRQACDVLVVGGIVGTRVGTPCAGATPRSRPEPLRERGAAARGTPRRRQTTARSGALARPRRRARAAARCTRPRPRSSGAATRRYRADPSAPGAKGRPA